MISVGSRALSAIMYGVSLLCATRRLSHQPQQMDSAVPCVSNFEHSCVLHHPGETGRAVFGWIDDVISVNSAGGSRATDLIIFVSICVLHHPGKGGSAKYEWSAGSRLGSVTVQQRRAMLR